MVILGGWGKDPQDRQAGRYLRTDEADHEAGRGGWSPGGEGGVLLTLKELYVMKNC